jgi:Putative beta barrel porin-7 (BBP7)
MYRCGISLLTLLVATTIAFGQPSIVVPTPSENWPETSNPLTGTLSSVFDNLNHGGSFFVTGEAEYLLWFLKGSRPSVSIATTATDNPIGQQLGDTNSGIGPISGGRFAFGYWQYESNPWISQGTIRTFGVEARFLFVGNPAAEFNADVPPNLFRPFFDLNNRTDSSFLVASPGIATGGINARGQLGIWGAEANVWKNVYYDKPGTTCAIDLMAGVRYLQANSELEINSTSVFSNTIAAGSPFASFAGNRLQVTDSFDMRNQFLGGQVGIGAKGWLTEHASVEGSLRLAIGTTRQESTINGGQVRTFANGTTTNFQGGLLALPSNIGTRTNYQFSQVPEGNVKLLFPIGNQITLSAGFSAIYWNRVIRAANQIDRSIDISQIPNFPNAATATSTGLGRPGVLFQQSDLWMLGISFGVEYRW